MTSEQFISNLEKYKKEMKIAEDTLKNVAMDITTKINNLNQTMINDIESLSIDSEIKEDLKLQMDISGLLDNYSVDDFIDLNVLGELYDGVEHSIDALKDQDTEQGKTVTTKVNNRLIKKQA